jgi:hypothetical protein
MLPTAVNHPNRDYRTPVVDHHPPLPLHPLLSSSFHSQLESSVTTRVYMTNPPLRAQVYYLHCCQDRVRISIMRNATSASPISSLWFGSSPFQLTVLIKAYLNWVVIPKCSLYYLDREETIVSSPKVETVCDVRSQSAKTRNKLLSSSNIK